MQLRRTLSLLPGLILVLLIAVISRYTSELVPISSLTLGIIFGILFSNVVGISERLQPGVTFTVKKLLKLGIILLGVELNFVALYQSGPKILLLAVMVVVLGVTVAMLVGKMFGLSGPLSALLGVGSSICGSSAVVAVAPVVDADKDETALAAGIISLLGALGVLIYPVIGDLVHFTTEQFGYWSGSSLQGVAHALAAAFTKGEVSLEAATYVKMTRVVLLAPTTVVLSMLFGKSQGSGKVKFPGYVVAFILVGVVASLGIFEYSVAGLTLHSLLKQSSKFLILMAMIAMGLGVDLSKIKQVGLNATVTTCLVFAVLGTVSGVFVALFV